MKLPIGRSGAAEGHLRPVTTQFDFIADRYEAKRRRRVQLGGFGVVFVLLFGALAGGGLAARSAADADRGKLAATPGGSTTPAASPAARVAAVRDALASGIDPGAVTNAVNGSLVPGITISGITIGAAPNSSPATGASPTTTAASGPTTTAASGGATSGSSSPAALSVTINATASSYQAIDAWQDALGQKLKNTNVSFTGAPPSLTVTVTATVDGTSPRVAEFDARVMGAQ